MNRRRVTIADIAHHAKVSTTSVSYALNDLPGVGAQTRSRILAVADSLGWRPSSAARTLHSSRTNAVGLLLLSDERPHGEGADFFVAFLSGVQAALAEHDVLLTLHSVPDRATANETYKRWWAERRVDGVILLNPLRRDPRLVVLAELGIPTVVVGEINRRHSLSAVYTDDQHASELAIARLAELGHRRIARLGLGPGHLHSEIRHRAFEQSMRRHGMEADLSVYIEDDEPHVVALNLLAGPRPPTAIVVEDSLVAVNTMLGLQAAGVRVPDDLSMVAWDDAIQCRLVRPAMTALRRNLEAYGSTVADRLIRSVDGEPPSRIKATTTELVERGSIAAPPR